MASPIPSVALAPYPRYSEDEMRSRAEALHDTLNMRRTVRDFSDAPVPREVIESCIKTASTAPSGANQQPWHFAVVGDPKIKRQIREAAEAEERAFYEHRASDEWRDALSHLGTDAEKPYWRQPLILLWCLHWSTVPTTKASAPSTTILMSPRVWQRGF